LSECSLKSKNWPCFLKNQSCQERNKNWACIHELKCLLVFKQVEAGKELSFLCKELAEDKDFRDIGTENRNLETSCEYSIKQKVYNIHSLSEKKIPGLGVQDRASSTTKKIFKICENWTIEELKQEIKKLKEEQIKGFFPNRQKKGYD